MSTESFPLTATSGLPSPLKSATTGANGDTAVPEFMAAAKRSVAVAEHDCDGLPESAVRSPRNHEIGLAIQVHVRRQNRIQILRERVACSRGKCSIAIAEKNGNAVLEPARADDGRQIQLAVMIEVRRSHI